MHHKDGGSMRALALIFSTFLLMCTDSVARPRLVSTSLCSDAYILSTVRGKDITALSWQANDQLSNASQNLRGKPKAWDNIERLLALDPTLVVFGPGEGEAAKPLLDKAGIKYLGLVWGEDFASIDANLKLLAEAMGVLPDLTPKPKAPSGRKVKILYLSASGGTAGPDTYVDAVIEQAGGTNIITTPGWHTPDIETLVGLEPDLIVTSFFKDGYASVNTAGLNNKVLQNKLKATPHINVPGKLWPCAGPGLYAATDIIANAIKELP